MHLNFHGLLPFRLEQAVYGSFPFWNRGYGILARSAGCPSASIAAFKSACQRFGERPAGTQEADALFAQPLDRGSSMIVGVYPRGADDCARPGAIVFHALFAPRWFYRLAAANPFRFSPLLRGDWDASDVDRILPPLDRLTSRQPHSVAEQDPEIVLPAIRILESGRRVLLVSEQPAPALTAEIWGRIPSRIRRRSSMATWAYQNDNQFSLVTMPRRPRHAAAEFSLIIDVAAPANPISTFAPLAPETIAF